MSKKIIISVLVAVILLTGCSANEQASIPDATTISEVETTTTITTTEITTTTEATTTVDNKAVAKELATEAYAELNSVYENCNLYSEFLIIKVKQTALSIEYFAKIHPIPYEFVRKWADDFYDNYYQENGKRYKEDLYIDSWGYTEEEFLKEQEESLITVYANDIVADYLVSINWKDNIETSLENTKQAIQEINSLEISEAYVEKIIEYYSICNSICVKSFTLHIKNIFIT